MSGEGETEIMSFDRAEYDRLCAFHEAGHCVVGHYFGWTLTPDSTGIQIGRSPGCYMRFPAHDRTSFRAIQVLVAGWAAETMHSPDKARRWSSDEPWTLYNLFECMETARFDPPGEDEPEGDDESVFRLLLEAQPGLSDDDLLKAYTMHTEEVLSLLREPKAWAGVERLAAALLIGGAITDPEHVKRLIEGIDIPDDEAEFGPTDPRKGPFVVDIGVSSIGNPGPSAWAARIMRPDGQSTLLNAAVPNATSAAISAIAFVGVLKALPEGASGIVRSRDKNAIETINTYLPKWEVNGWKKAGKKPVANRDLWRSVAAFKAKHPELSFEWAETSQDLGASMEEEAQRLARAEATRLRMIAEGQGKR